MASGNSSTDPQAVDLRSLVGHTASVPAELTVEALQAEFAHTNADFLAVIDGNHLIGVCARRELVQALGSRFGFSLNARQSVRAHLMAAPLRVTVGTALTTIFQSAAKRIDREFYDDVLLVDELDRYIGMIPMRTLVRLQTEFLLGNIVSLEASRHDIAAKNHEMEQDLLMAREVQLALLPQSHPQLVACGLTLRTAHRFHPAGGVSGDFFDVLHLSDNSTGILVCDVMGHGVRSALVTAMVRAVIEELKPIAADPALFLTRLNRDLTNILRQTGSLIFVTAAYVVIDLSCKRIRYAQAGHPTPLLWEENTGIARPLCCPPESAGPALGLIDEFVFVMADETISIGDRVFLYTDGVTEAPALDGEEFGVARLANALSRYRALSLETALNTVLTEVTDFCGGPFFPDDVCVVAAELIQP